jgi:ParB family chromosome partitioning protein
VSPRRGLPDTVKSRFESHYVDELATSLPEPLGLFVPVKMILPNENQPRANIGDLSGLKQSIKSKGIVEPIVVRRLGDSYQIISGERRYLAARELGLEEVPCVVREADDLEALEVALIENLQRKDLTPFEEAYGYKQLIEKHSYTHDEIAEQIGKSRTSVTEILSLTRIPDDIRDLCSKHGINAKSMLLQIARQDTASDMLELTQQIVSHGITRAEARSRRPHLAAERAKPHTFNFKAQDKSFKVTIKFKKSDVSHEEVKKALQAAIDYLDSRKI